MGSVNSNGYNYYISNTCGDTEIIVWPDKQHYCNDKYKAEIQFKNLIRKYPYNHYKIIKKKNLNLSGS